MKFCGYTFFIPKGTVASLFGGRGPRGNICKDTSVKQWNLLIQDLVRDLFPGCHVVLMKTRDGAGVETLIYEDNQTLSRYIEDFMMAESRLFISNVWVCYKQ